MVWRRRSAASEISFWVLVSFVEGIDSHGMVVLGLVLVVDEDDDENNKVVRMQPYLHLLQHLPVSAVLQRETTQEEEVGLLHRRWLGESMRCGRRHGG
jgi:hypothetical protein